MAPCDAQKHLNGIKSQKFFMTLVWGSKAKKILGIMCIDKLKKRQNEKETSLPLFL